MNNFKKILNLKSYLLNQQGLVRFTKRTLITTFIVWFVILGSGLLYLFNPFQKTADAAWFDDNWAYRKTLTFTHNASVTSPTQVEFDIDTQDSPDKFQADCGDVRFTDYSGQLLRYYLDSAAGACDTASTDFDVLMPTIINGTNTIYMYYGNPTSSNGTEAADFTESTTTPSGGAASAGSEEKGTGPTLYWKFDDVTGTSEDTTMNELDGTQNNTPTVQTEDLCISSRCLYFDGANNENVSKSDDAKLDFAASDSFTIQAWVKRAGSSSANNFIITKAAAGYTGYKLYQDASGDYCFDVSDGTNTDTACTSAVEFDDSLWHFVQGVKSGTSSITLYVDGKQRAQDASIAATGTLANSGTFYAGVDLDGTSNEWLGHIDEVKVYAYARSAAQVQSDFNTRSNNEGAGVQVGSANPINDLEVQKKYETYDSALTSNLVGHWKFNDSSWTNDCSTATVTDSSGNSNTGKSCPNTTGPTTPNHGRFSSGAKFDGSNDYFDIPDHSSLRQDTFTMSLWFNMDTAAAACIFCKQFGSSTNNSFAIYMGSASIVSVGVSTNGGTFTSISYGDIGVGRWRHVAITKSGTTLTLFIDGKQIATATTASATIDYDSNGLFIGNDDNDGDNVGDTPFDGKIDDARYYSTALTAAQIEQLAIYPPAPIAYWDFNEGTGTTAYDKSTQANNSTAFVGNATFVNLGKFGNGVSFDGSGDYVNYGNPSTLNPIEAITISAWVKTTGTSAAGIVSKWATENNTNGGQAYALVMNAAGTVACVINAASGGADLQVDSVATINDGKWHYVTCMHDSNISTANIKVYIDGNLSNTGNSTQNIATTTDRLEVGSHADAAGSFVFNGTIDEVVMYAYARTAQQVIQDMNAGHLAPGSPVGSAVGYWKFDEGALNTCSGGSNDACNSGNGSTTLDGTFNGDATYTNSGNFGKAVTLDGTGDYVNVADSAALDITTNITLATWIYPTTISDTDSVVRKGAGANGVYYLILASDTIRLAINDTGWDTGGCTLSSANTWYHIVGTYDGANRKVYVNGNLCSTTAQTGAINTNALALTFGQAGDGTEYFEGRLDDVKIYSFALTADQIKADMNRGSSQVLGALGDNSTYQPNAANQEYCVPGDSTSCAAPVGRWDFEEGTGSTVYDKSGNSNGSWNGSGTQHYKASKIGYAGNFDGTTDYISIAQSSSINPTTAGTISAWVYITGDGTPDGSNLVAIATNVNAAGTLGWSLDYRTTDNKLDFYIANNGSTGSEDFSTNAVSRNTWHFISVTYDGTNKKIYIDGNLDSTIARTANGNNTSNGWTIARRPTSAARFLNGQIDNVRIFNYARSAAQIAYDYNRGGPVGHWKFDECQGTILNDASITNTNNGTWTGTGAGNTVAGTCTSPTDGTGAWYDGSTGKFNSSLDFDGTDDAVTITNTSAIDLNEGLATAHTIVAWVYVDSDGENDLGHVYGKDDTAPPETYLRVAGESGGRVNVEAGIDLATSDSTVSVSSAIATGTWNHIAVIYVDDSDDEIEVYINGALRGTGSGGSGAPNTDTSDLIIGNSAATTRTFDGRIDDFRIYNYALTTTQLKQVMNQGAVRFGPTTGSP